MRRRIPCCITMIAIALLAASCSGPGTMDGGSASGNQPLIVDPSSGGSAAEPTDQESDAALPGSEGSGEADLPSTSGISCTFDKSVDAKVNKAFSLKLTASGGSNDYLFTAEELPQGLALPAGSQTIAGTPDVAGDFRAGIAVKDIQSDRTERCSLRIRVSEQITLIALSAPPGRPTSELWNLSIGGTADGGTYHWGFSESAGLCGNAGNLELPGSTCSTPPTTGKGISLWMDPRPLQTKEITVTVNGDHAIAPVSVKVTFSPLAMKAEPLAPTQGGSGSESGTSDAQPRKAVSIALRTVTAPLDFAGTDCRLELQMCTDDTGDVGDLTYHQVGVKNCRTLTAKTTASGVLEKGKVSSFAFPAPAGITSEHRFFSIGLKKDGCSAPPDRDTYLPYLNRGWLLQGFELIVLYDDGTRYRYFNPCVEKWIAGGESLKFSRKDAAVCAIVSTSDLDKAGTNDLVRMLVQVDNDAAPEFWSASIGMASYDTGAMPHFLGTHKPTDSSANSYGQLFLNWSVNVPFGMNTSHGLAYLLTHALDQIAGPMTPSASLMGSAYDDFTRGASTSYGDYVFGWDPFLQDNVNVRLEKNADGERGGWHLQQYEVFIFNPGMKNGGNLRHLLCAEDRWIQDLSDASGEAEGGLITDFCMVKRSAQGENLIADAIGGHFD